MLAEGLRDRGHEQFIACLEESALVSAVRKLQIQTFTLPPFDPWNAFGIMLLRQLAGAWRPQIIHAHDGRGQSIAWLASLGFPVKRIASRRVTFLPSAGWTYRLKYERSCQAVIAVSERIRELSVEAGVSADRVHVIPDGIDLLAQLPPKRECESLRSSWGMNDKHFVVGLLGAPTHEKGHDVAVAAVEQLKVRMPNLKLVHAVTEDPSHAAKNLAAANQVHRLVGVKTLAEFFPGLDLFVMPSRSEGLGSSALWAMAYGLPVVATRVGGLPEIVTENETGWLIPPDSPDALAEAIVRAAKDRKLLTEYGRNGRTRAEAFSAEIMIDRTEALYEQLAGSAPK
jgi:glycosyltransferase involved in cell wall biosynthesis